MKQHLLFLALTSFAFLAFIMTGCGGNGGAPAFVPSPTPTPTPTPATQEQSAFASLRATGAQAITGQQRQAIRRTAKFDHASTRQAAFVMGTSPADIYIWPVRLLTTGWVIDNERKITSSAADYTAVHVSLKGTTIVFSQIVSGYNQIFTAAVPSEGQNLARVLQLTTDAEQHFVPHVSADGSKVVFTKFDPVSGGDVVCVINNTAGATEDCLDLGSSTPILKGAGLNLWHASWTPDGKIVFEAWGGPFSSDEIFMVKTDGSELTQITKNAGTNDYDECPSVDPKGQYMVATKWNDTTQHYENTWIDLNTLQESPDTGVDFDSWDPLFLPYGSFVWVSQQPTDHSLELYYMSFSPLQLTANTFADSFESSPRP